MCSAHVGGATASQDGGSVTMHRHSPLAFANPSKNHSGFAHVGSDGLRRLTNKSKPGITCEHASRASVSVSSAHGNVRYYSQRPTSSFAEPSRLRGMDMLQGSMCSAHVGGATASQFHHK